jgi:hypothetical protein
MMVGRKNFPGTAVILLSDQVIFMFSFLAVPSVLGLIYLYARYKYFYGYAEAGEKRYNFY